MSYVHYYKVSMTGNDWTLSQNKTNPGTCLNKRPMSAFPDRCSFFSIKHSEEKTEPLKCLTVQHEH